MIIGLLFLSVYLIIFVLKWVNFLVELINIIDRLDLLSDDIVFLRVKCLIVLLILFFLVILVVLIILILCFFNLIIFFILFLVVLVIFDIIDLFLWVIVFKSEFFFELGWLIIESLK